MADIRDAYGKVIYRKEGNRILDIYGNWKHNGRAIKCTQGVDGYANSSWVYQN